MLCVDDDALLLRTVEALVRVHPSLVWVGSLNRADNLVAVCQHDSPDIVLLDIDMRGADPFGILRRLSAACRASRVIMFSSHLTAQNIAQAIDSGAWGFVYKLDAPSTVVEAIWAVAAGEFLFSPTARQMHFPAQ